MATTEELNALPFNYTIDYPLAFRIDMHQLPFDDREENDVENDALELHIGFEPENYVLKSVRDMSRDSLRQGVLCCLYSQLYHNLLSSR